MTSKFVLALQVFSFFSLQILAQEDYPDPPNCPTSGENGLNAKKRKSLAAQIEGIKDQCDGGPEYICFFESLAGKELQNPNNYRNNYKEIIKLEDDGERQAYSSTEAFLNATAKNWTNELKNMGQKYEYGCQCSDENGKYKVVCFFV
ncbi:hypothetical protein ANCCAN_10990 [Ancylostoma caninum]|uniref:SCP domain-containing protein n=1 Tax=Ancylostoma caninum TaxID=29170 RepID=A0A368GJ19_ANCCA|nr:hypothetical protein ANCCAN_10990 [Ancylostoma caninum]